MARANGFTRVRHEERVVGHRCLRCECLVSSYFLKQHRCSVTQVVRPETKEERQQYCWESGFRAGKIEGKCPVCHGSRIRYKSTSGTTFQMMHIIPKSQGGATASWNLLPGCGCNQNMGALNLLDWMGTRGNKRELMKPLMLRKYRSLVAPEYRSRGDKYQLVEWVRQLYKPRQLEQYEKWLLLQVDDLRRIVK